MRRLRAGDDVSRALGRPGSPSGPTTGVCRFFCAAGRGTGKGGKPPGEGHVARIPPSPRKNGPGALRRRGGALTGVAVHREMDRVTKAPPPRLSARRFPSSWRGEFRENSGASRREIAKAWLFDIRRWSTTKPPRHCEEPTGPFRRPDDKLRDAAIQSRKRRLDCFVARAPRMTAERPERRRTRATLTALPAPQSRTNPVGRRLAGAASTAMHRPSNASPIISMIKWSNITISPIR
jgi:hypothetical protein